MERPVEAEQAVLSAHPTANTEPQYRANARESVSHLQKMPGSAQMDAKTIEAGSCGSSAYADQHAYEHSRPDPKKPYAASFSDIDLSIMQTNGSRMPATSARPR